VNKRSLHLLLLLISWTVLSGQTQGSSLVSKDTKRCYDTTELRSIALRLISGVECDTLLKVAKLTIAAQDTVIKSQAKTIDIQEVRYHTTERLAKEYLDQKQVVQKELKKAKRRLVWTKIGWAATTVVLTTTTILALIH
jgi:hypothetical protein